MMRDVYSAEFQPDPHDSISVLAFLLCPAAAFLAGEDDLHGELRDEEVAAVEALMAPVKQEVVRRWHEARHAGRVN